MKSWAFLGVIREIFMIQTEILEFLGEHFQDFGTNIKSLKS